MGRECHGGGLGESVRVVHVPVPCSVSMRRCGEKGARVGTLAARAQPHGHGAGSEAIGTRGKRSRRDRQGRERPARREKVARKGEKARGARERMRRTEQGGEGGWRWEARGESTNEQGGGGGGGGASDGHPLERPEVRPPLPPLSPPLPTRRRPSPSVACAGVQRAACKKHVRGAGPDAAMRRGLASGSTTVWGRPA